MMLRWIVATVILGLLTLGASACGGGDELRPADEARAEESAKENAAARQIEMGGTAEFDKVRLTMKEITYEANARGDEDVEKWAIASVRVENTGKEEGYRPDMKIVCDGGVEGKWYTLDAPDSLDDEYSLPGKSYVEGRMKFSVPPGCVNGKLNAEFTGMSIGKEPPDAQWRLP